MTVAALEFWKTKLSKNYDLIEKAVQRRFRGDSEMAEEALSYISEKLVEDDMRRLRLYDPKRGAKFQTYLSVLSQRLISRYLEQKKGRFRFPKWLEDQGNALWMKVYRLLCWERNNEIDVVETIKTTAPGKRDAIVVNEAIWIIREKYPDCGKSREKEVQTEDENYYPEERQNNESAFHHLTPEEQVALGQRMALSDAILSAPEKESNPDSDDTQMAEIKKKLAQEFKPGPEKRLFLRMIYQDGMSVSEAGRQLGWNANQAAGHHRRLMEQLKEIIGDDFLI